MKIPSGGNGGTDAPVREFTLEVGPIVLNLVEYGPADGQPVVLLHGHADSAWSMDTIARFLAGSAYRVLSADLRGHGGSGRGPYTLPHLIADLHGLITGLELEAPIIIGHSLGGQTAAQYAGLFPEVPRALISVEGIGPPPSRQGLADPDQAERDDARRLVTQLLRPARAKSMGSMEAAVDRFHQAHPGLDRRRAAFLVGKASHLADDGTVTWRFDPATRDWLAGYDFGTARLRWRGVRCPVLVVTGDQSYDRFWRHLYEDPDHLVGPLEGEWLEERLSHFAGAAFVRHQSIEGAGHMIPYDQPDRLNQVIAGFLSELAAS